MPINRAFALPLADILIFGTIALFALNGFKRGVLRTLFRLLRVYFSFIITAILYERAALILRTTFDMPSPLAQTTSFAVIFAMSLAAIWIVVRTLKKASKPVQTSSALSKTGGTILGIAEGTLIISIIIMAIGFYSPPLIQSSLEGAISYKTIKQVAPEIKSFTVEQIPHVTTPYP